MTNRRAFLLGIGAALAAPAVIRTAGLLMPVKPVVVAPVPMTATEVLLRQAKMQELLDAHVMVAMREMQAAFSDMVLFGHGALKIGPGEISHVPYRLIPIDVWNRENA